MPALYEEEEIGWDRLDKKKFFLYGMGMFSGVTMCLYPLSVIKTRQMAVEGVSGGFEGVKETVKVVWKQDGLRGFYKGIGTVIFGTIPARVVYLGTLEAVKATVNQTGKQLNLSETALAAASNGLAGAAASMATQTVTVPVDVVSSRLMVQGADLAGGPSTRPSPASAAPAAGTGTRPVAAAPLAKGEAALHASAPQGGPSNRQFSGLTANRMAAGQHTAEIARPLSHASASTSMSAQRLPRQGLSTAAGPQAPAVNGLQMARLIIRQEGVVGLYRGFGASIATFVPSSAVWWGAYGAYQKFIWQLLYQSRGSVSQQHSRHDAVRHNAAEVLVVQTSASLLAGVTSAIATNPLDLIKVRLQVARKQEGQELSFRSLLRELLQQEGLPGLMRGVMPRMASTALWGTAMVSTYELLKRLCQIPKQ